MNNKKPAIYSRKSKFTGKGESIENQIEMCRKYLSELRSPGAAAEALIYEDEGYSGSNLDRPMFREMMKDAENGIIDSIIVYRLDRISRNTGDFVRLAEKLEILDIDFISIKEQFDTSSPMGRAMMYISSVFSQLERETIAERIRDNMQELARTGRWLGGVTPTGYISETVSYKDYDGKIRKKCRLKIQPDEIKKIEKIFSLFLENHSIRKTVDAMIEEKQLTRKGCQFTRYSVRSILTNPVYMCADRNAYEYFSSNNALIAQDSPEFDGTYGIMAYSRTLQQHGRSTKMRPVSQWIIAVGEHNAIISGSDWVNVQKILARNVPAKSCEHSK